MGAQRGHEFWGGHSTALCLDTAQCDQTRWWPLGPSPSPQDRMQGSSGRPMWGYWGLTGTSSWKNGVEGPFLGASEAFPLGCS